MNWLRSKKLKDRVRNWWAGEIIPYENDPNSSIVFIGWDEKRHWTARAVQASWTYFKDHHRWIIGTAVALFGVIVAALSL